MDTPRIIGKDAYKRTAWKNGLGYTDEIAIYPPGSDLRRGDFLWRISSAQIAQSSAFSVFPNHDRILIILEGQGIRLTHTIEDDQDEVTLPPLSLYEFPGDISSRCDLISGPVVDLSIFIRKGEAEALPEVLNLTRPDEEHGWSATGKWNYLFVVQGTVEVRSQSDDQTHRIEQGSTFESSEAEYLIQSLTPQAVLVSIALSA